MSVHSGTIAGNVGGRYCSMRVVVVHCDRCDDTHCEPGIAEEGAALDCALDDGWNCDNDEADLCPDCAAKARELSRG